jgi:hypothetical protein
MSGRTCIAPSTWQVAGWVVVVMVMVVLVVVLLLVWVVVAAAVYSWVAENPRHLTR